MLPDCGYELRRGVYSAEEIESVRLNSEKLWKRAKKGWVYAIRVEDDFPHWLGGINVFGVENPFPYVPALSNLLPRFEGLLRDSVGWPGATLELARLHVADRFKYQGFWHRDATPSRFSESVVAIVYLLPERGFRVLPAQHICNGVLGDQLQSAHARDAISGEHVLDAQAGDVFLFRSSLLHRGYISGPRMHLHLRFVRSATYDVEQWQRWESPTRHLYLYPNRSQQYRALANYLRPRDGHSSLWQTR